MAPASGTALNSRVAVRLRGVRKAYGAKHVLDGIELDIHPGEFVALLGPSGTGKTTLLRLLSGLEVPDAGTVLVPQRRTIVYQEPRLVQTHRVLANVTIGQRRGSATREAALRALTEVGLGDKARSWPATLSGGEAQRVALARALVREPELLLLDEPFAALDALTRLQTQDLVGDLYARHRPAVLLVTHDVDEAVRLADRVLVLRDGRFAVDTRVEVRRPRRADSAAVATHRRRLLAELGVTVEESAATGVPAPAPPRPAAENAPFPAVAGGSMTTASSPGTALGAARSDVPGKIWYTRCPVPTASGLALHRGTLAEEFAARGLDFGVLQDGPPELVRHHFDHRLVGLFREGGNVPALAARSEGAPTRLIGLTWIDERQSILVRPDSGISGADDLKGVRVALPGWADSRAGSFPRAMALHGFAGALATAGLGLADVRFVEVDAGAASGPARIDGGGTWSGLAELASGEVDAVYVKGARAAEEGAKIGAVVAVDLDSGADRRFRVNNGTPRPITVHEQLLAEHEDVVVGFLAQTLRAADWAAGHPDELRVILAQETRSGSAGVDRAYRAGFHLGLHPDLSADRLELLGVQKDFLLLHGFLAADVDVAAWTADEPLAKARALVAADVVEGASA